MNDKLFLLSTEEYEKYKGVISHIKMWWWLRSPGDYSNYAASVRSGGSINYFGNFVYRDNDAVRPALRIENLRSSPLKVGDRIVVYKFPFIVIDATEGLAIAEVPIAFRRYDKASNDYSNSEIRQFLVEWAVERED